MSKLQILLTGGTDGIGKQVALRLAGEGAKLVIMGRSEAKAALAFDHIRAEHPAADLEFWAADLSLMRDAKALSERVMAEFSELNTIIHCAGVMLRKRTLTDEGLETVFAVQYLARWLLNRELAPLLDKRESPAIINVSAGGAIPMRLNWENLMGEKFYHGAIALMHESVANDMQTLDYQAQFPNIDFYCYGPFWVPDTNLMSDMSPIFRKIGEVSGAFFGYPSQRAAEDIANLLEKRPTADLVGRKLKPAKPTKWKADAQNIGQLRDYSEQLVSEALLDS